jgi:hypothetical protein
MAEGPGGLTDVGARDPADPRPIAAELTHRRDDLTVLMGELSRRAHELTDLRLQIRRHALGVAATVLAVGGVAAGAIALGVWRARRRDTMMARGGRLSAALGRMIDRPERVAVQPTVTHRILASAGSAVAALLIKAVLQRLAADEVAGSVRSRPHSVPSGRGRVDPTSPIVSPGSR